MSNTSATEVPLPLDQQIQASVNALLTPEFIAERVTTAMTTLVDKAIKDHFDPWTASGKAIIKDIQGQLAVPTLDLPDYTADLMKMFEAAMAEKTHELLAKATKEMLDDIAEKAPKTYSLQKLFTLLIQGNYQYEDDYIEKMGSIYISEISRATNTYWVYMDDEQDVEKYNCRYRISVANGVIEAVELEGKKTYATKTAPERYGFSSEFDRMLKTLWLCQVPFEMCEEDDLNRRSAQAEND